MYVLNIPEKHHLVNPQHCYVVMDDTMAQFMLSLKRTQFLFQAKIVPCMPSLLESLSE